MSIKADPPPGAFAWTITQARCLARKSQMEIARAARLSFPEMTDVEAGRLVPRLWQVLLLADALDLDRAGLCRLAAAEGGSPRKRAATAGVSLPVPGQHRRA